MAVYKRLGYRIKIFDKSGVNTSEDIESLKLWGYWRAVNKYDGTGDLVGYVQQSVRFFVLDQINWKKKRGEEVPLEFFEDDRFTKSCEDEILMRIRLSWLVEKYGNNTQKQIVRLMLEDTSLVQDSGQPNHERISIILGLNPSTICNAFMNFKRKVLQRKGAVNGICRL